MIAVVSLTAGLAAIYQLTAATAAADTGATRSVPTCRTSDLVVWLDTRGGAAAGSVYYHLEFTNLASKSCSLRGYPGVSAVGLRGEQRGHPASRNPQHLSRTVTLTRGSSAFTILQISNAANFPVSVCKPTTAAGVRVYSPGQTASQIVPFPFPACSRSRPVYLSVESIQQT